MNATIRINIIDTPATMIVLTCTPADKSYMVRHDVRAENWPHGFLGLDDFYDLFNDPREWIIDYIMDECLKYPVMKNLFHQLYHNEVRCGRRK